MGISIQGDYYAHWGNSGYGMIAQNEHTRIFGNYNNIVPHYHIIEFSDVAIDKDYIWGLSGFSGGEGDTEVKPTALNLADTGEINIPLQPPSERIENLPKPGTTVPVEPAPPLPANNSTEESDCDCPCHDGIDVHGENLTEETETLNNNQQTELEELQEQYTQLLSKIATIKERLNELSNVVDPNHPDYPTLTTQIINLSQELKNLQKRAEFFLNKIKSIHNPGGAPSYYGGSSDIMDGIGAVGSVTGSFLWGFGVTGPYNIGTSVGSMVAELGLSIVDTIGVGVDLIAISVGYPLGYEVISTTGQAIEYGELSCGGYYAIVGREMITFGTYGQVEAFLQYQRGEITADEASGRIGAAAFGQLLLAKGLQGTRIGTSPLKQLPRIALEETLEVSKQAYSSGKKILTELAKDEDGNLGPRTPPLKRGNATNGYSDGEKPWYQIIGEGSVPPDKVPGGKLVFPPSNPSKPVPQLPVYAGKKTSGVLRYGETDVELVSGYNGPSASMPKGTPGMNGRIKSHVEAHAASIMREEGILEATLYINRKPCPGKTGCYEMLPRMLPKGARLRVIGPDGFDEVFVGIAD